MEELISVIVPVYNGEKLLPKCMEYLLGQTWQDFEIILVDDGSRDGTGSLCESSCCHKCHQHHNNQEHRAHFPHIQLLHYSFLLIDF